MTSWDWPRDSTFTLLRGEARRLRAGARAFLMGEAVVRCFDWAREDGFAFADWERVVVAIVDFEIFGGKVVVFGGGGGKVGDVAKAVLR